jgi:molybdopterin synthase catalytic subunit
MAGVLTPPDGADWLALTDDELPVAAATTWATTPGTGGVVLFLGVVRDHAEGRHGVHALTYEAYEEHVVPRLAEITVEIRRQWPEVERVALLHRTGRVELSDASVAVVVSAPHRGTAFDAARFAIDTLKESVPIWKQEHWADGSAWGTGAAPIRPVRALHTA